MPREIYDLTIDEISLVDRGANADARVVLLKRDGEMTGPKTFKDLMSQRKAEDDLWRVFGVFREVVESVLSSGESNKQALIKDAFDQFSDALKPIIEVKKMSGNNDLTAVTEALTKAEERLATLDTGLKDAQAEIAKRDAKIAELEKVAKADQNQTDQTEDVLKSAPESIRKAFEALNARVAASEAVAKRMQDERELEAFSKRAGQFERLTFDVKTFGPLLHRIAKGATTAADADEVERVLKAADAALKAGGVPLTEIGKSGGDRGGSAETAIAAKAEEIRKRDPKLSVEQAAAKALEEDPSLYRRYLAERAA